MGLKLADISEIFVDTAFVGRRRGAFVATGPFAKHTCSIAVVAEDFGNDYVGCVVRLLTYYGEVGVLAIEIGLEFVAPVFAVAAHVGVAAVLPGHERGARRC